MHIECYKQDDRIGVRYREDDSNFIDLGYVPEKIQQRGKFTINLYAQRVCRHHLEKSHSKAPITLRSG